MVCIENFFIWKILHGAPLLAYPYDLPQDFPVNDKLDKERWVFISGNLVMLNEIFHRPILGINNQTYGFCRDILQCVLQRSLGFQTRATRITHRIIKELLLDPSVDRVVIIAHSQGGIITSQVLDTLYTELRDLDLQKLEVYTFGNAALRFNNPRRVISHIEHYCNERDPACSWGAMSSDNRADVRFDGRVFILQGRSGHLLNQHYLSRMFAPHAARATEEFAKDRFSQPTRSLSRLHQYAGGNIPPRCC
ncbi:hypothetical protein BJY01DRAFT_231340 [Aspergillus pseudoustus]|uniref:DUF676 domain-containing protein n=1 Tax=Aspergillus pseudoustus TaxID=1810923 RepID=A0ABR4KW27_9EURO